MTAYRPKAGMSRYDSLQAKTDRYVAVTHAHTPMSLRVMWVTTQSHTVNNSLAPRDGAASAARNSACGEGKKGACDACATHVEGITLGNCKVWNSPRAMTCDNLNWPSGGPSRLVNLDPARPCRHLDGRRRLVQVGVVVHLPAAVDLIPGHPMSRYNSRMRTARGPSLHWRSLSGVMLRGPMALDAFVLDVQLVPIGHAFEVDEWDVFRYLDFDQDITRLRVAPILELGIFEDREGQFDVSRNIYASFRHDFKQVLSVVSDHGQNLVSAY